MIDLVLDLTGGNIDGSVGKRGIVVERCEERTECWVALGEDLHLLSIRLDVVVDDLRVTLDSFTR